jgi:hypothetical protein
MKTVNPAELQKGDLIVVRWFDASELRGRLNQHEKPEVAVYEWGIYLGTRGQKQKHLLLGKDHIKNWDEWGVTRIPVSLIDEVKLLMPRSYQRLFPNVILKKIKIRRTLSPGRIRL